MSLVFVSHAVADRKIAELLVNFLKEAIGVPQSSIFCSSIKGHSIPFGEDFNEYMKDKIQEPDLVILLMTPAYVESMFCLMELGAAWAQSAKSLAIVVPPISFDIVTKTLGLKQAWKITEKSGLVDLRSLVRKQVENLESRSDHTWDDKRLQWGLDLKKTLLKLQQATKVDAQVYQKVANDLAEREEEVERLENKLVELQDHISRLEKLKNKEEVRALKRAASNTHELQEQFGELLSAVSEATPKASSLVVKHIILDHFDRAPSIDWFNEKWEFEQAIKYGLISSDDDHRVEWGRPKLKPLREAIQNVVTFLESQDGKKLKATQEPKVPMEPDDLEFWEHHLAI